MVCFSSPGFVDKGTIVYGIARRSPNTYLLVFARGYGMAVSRDVATLNASTPRSNSSPALPLSASGKPLIWLDPDYDRHPSITHIEDSSILKGILTAEPPVVRPTGRVRGMYMPWGGLKDAVEVELLLTEDELARACWYCNSIEYESDVQSYVRMQPCGGDGYSTTYICSQCQKRSLLGKAILGAIRTFSK